jgi:hypothetical protein
MAETVLATVSPTKRVAVPSARRITTNGSEMLAATMGEAPVSALTACSCLPSANINRKLKYYYGHTRVKQVDFRGGDVQDT